MIHWLSFLRKISLGHFRKHTLEALLCLIGVALGVAVVIAIDSAVQACVSSFTGAVDTLAERSTHSIYSQGGAITDAQYIALADRGLPCPLAPMIDRGVLIGKQDSGIEARLIGVDVFSERALRSFTNVKAALDPEQFKRFLTEPDQIVLVEPLAERLGVLAGQDVTLTIGDGRIRVHVLGVTRLEGLARVQLRDLIIVDLATAQELTQSLGQIDRIDVNISSPAQEQLVVAALPPGLVLRSTRQQETSLSDLIASYKLNLNSLSLMASFVAIFIVYNSMLVSVQQRAKSLGILRCLGSSRFQLVSIYLSEAIGFALLGGIIGVLGGWGLSRLLVSYISTTINDLYATVRPTAVPLTGAMFAKGLAVSTMSCVVGAALPLTRAARTPPINMMRATSRSEASHRAAGVLLALGLLLLALAYATYLLPTESPIVGFIIALTIALGFALICPMATLLFTRLIERIVHPLQLLPLQMASSGIGRSLDITGVAVAAMMLAMAMNVGVRTMVSSFRGELDSWLDRRFSADVLIAPELLVNHRIDATLDPRLQDWVERQPETAAIIHSRVRTFDLAGKPTGLMATDIAMLMERKNFPIKSTEPGREFDPRRDAFISEPLAGRLKLRPGDILVLQTPTGEQSLHIFGIYYDFGAEHGQVMLDLQSYRRLWQDDALTSMHVRLKPGWSPEEVAPRWSAILRRDYPIECNSFAHVKAEILQIFDRTFKVTDVLSWLSGGVAFCGLAGSLLALSLARSRDYSVLTAIGMSGRQRSAWVVGQGLIIAWISAAVACVAGTILALVLSYVIQYRSFGWSIPTSVQPKFWLEAFVLATAAALIASIYPIRKLNAAPPAASLRQE